MANKASSKPGILPPIEPDPGMKPLPLVIPRMDGIEVIEGLDLAGMARFLSFRERIRAATVFASMEPSWK